MKTCQICEESREEKDFFNSPNCFKCEYARKTAQRNGHQKCKMCDNDVDVNRSVYCSDECVLAGKDMHNKAYWTNHISNVGITHYKGFARFNGRRRRIKGDQ